MLDLKRALSVLGEGLGILVHAVKEISPDLGTVAASRVAPQGSSFKFLRTGVSSWKGCSVVPPRATSPLKAAEEHHQLMARANHKEETVRTDAQTDTANTVCAINEVNERVTVRRRDCKREECDTLKHRHCVKVRQ